MSEGRSLGNRKVHLEEETVLEFPTSWRQLSPVNEVMGAIPRRRPLYSCIKFSPDSPYFFLFSFFAAGSPPPGLLLSKVPSAGGV